MRPSGANETHYKVGASTLSEGAMSEWLSRYRQQFSRD